MYGTIGRYRVKPGMEAQFRHLFEEQERAFEGGQIPADAYRLEMAMAP